MLGAVLVVPLVLGGCGDAGTDDASTSPTTASSADDDCATSAAGAGTHVSVDLDGDGTAETVTYSAGDDATCPARLSTRVAGHDQTADLHDRLPVRAADMKAVRIPDRSGDLLLVTPQHPRGGFQAHLFGYADGSFAELTAEGRPVFGFIATDARTDPTAAHCVGDGFDVVAARAHEPIGVAPAWDVFRTTYTLDGNEVTKSDTTEVADNVLDRQLERDYGDLTGYALFEDCLVDR